MGPQQKVYKKNYLIIDYTTDGTIAEITKSYLSSSN